MKQLLLNGKSDIQYVTVPKPDCPEDGLLLQIMAVGLCGSDIRAYVSGSSNLHFPVVLGHEFVGIVDAVGPAAGTKWKVGDTVTVNPTVPCNTCHECLEGRHDICEHLEIAGNTFPGAFAQYIALPGFVLQRGQILRIPENTENPDAFVLTELLASVLKAQEDLQVSLGETVVIVGSGPIGCLHAQVARLRGASRVILAGRSRKRLEKCRGLGATHYVVTTEEDLIQRTLELTDNRGADVFISACPAWEPCQQGLALLRKEGRMSIFGGMPAGKHMAVLDANLVHYKRLRIMGSFTYPTKSFRLGFDLLCQGRINTNVITHVIPLSKMTQGVELVRSGEAIKVIMKPWME